MNQFVADPVCDKGLAIVGGLYLIIGAVYLVPVR